MTKTLSVKNLSASYGKTKILSDVSLELKTGEFVCLCGPNGAGKSTLLSILAGLQNESLKFSAERFPCIFSDGKPVLEIESGARKEIAKNISFLSQNENCTWDFTVLDVVLSGRFPYTDSLGNYSKNDYDFAQKIIRDFNIEHLAQKSVFNISGGELQKTRIARSFAQDTNFLLLDEPLSSLDIVYENNLMKLLSENARSQNKGVLISVHDLNMAARYADRIILLPPVFDDGMKTEIISGKPEEVRTAENLHTVYGTEFSVEKAGRKIVVRVE